MNMGLYGRSGVWGVAYLVRPALLYVYVYTTQDRDVIVARMTPTVCVESLTVAVQ